MPTGVSTKSSSANTPNSLVNKAPLTIVLRKGRMDRVHGIFEELQPVVWIEVFLARDQTIARPGEAVVYREWRLPVGRPQMGKDDAVVLVGRISR
jgi:hypothetical protein